MNSRLLALPALILAWAVSYGLWWQLGKPVPVHEMPSPRLECVSFTPYLGDENPLKHTFMVPDRLIRDSLVALKPYTECIRLYSSLGAYERVVPIAAELGIKVMLGMWIGTRDDLNAKEIETGLALAARHPDAVTLLIVGNEVLLRREMSGNKLAAIIRSVKERTKIPVAYADIPHFWTKNPVVGEAVDVVGIHLLPYWDDPTPFSIDEVQEHLKRLSATMVAAFPKKPILVAEVGWPSAGRTRGAAAPTIVNEARFVREFATWAKAANLSYNLIEGLDQPWKRAPEGTVGGYWGVLDRHLDAKFPLSGPVSEWPYWNAAAVFSGIVATLLLAAAWFSRRRIGVAGWLTLSVTGPAFGASLVGLGHMMETVPLGWPGMIGVAGLAVLVMGSTALIALHAAAADELRLAEIRPASFSRVAAWLRAPLKPCGRDVLLGALHWGVMGSAAFLALELAFDGRHRDFPLVAFAIPAVAFLIHAWRSRRTAAEVDLREEAWVALALVLCGPFAVDSLHNRESIMWAALCLALAAPWIPMTLREARRLAHRLSKPAPASPVVGSPVK